MVVSPRKEVAAILPAGCAWVAGGGGGGGLCCENMLFLTEVEGFNRLLTVFHTNVSLHSGRDSCRPLIVSTPVLVNKTLEWKMFLFLRTDPLVVVFNNFLGMVESFL